MSYTLGAVLALSLSCSPAGAAPPVASATIQGQILHPAGKTLTVEVRGRRIAETPVDANGRFRLVVPLAEAGAATLETGDEVTDLWLTPGDNLTLTLDARQFDETVKYAGTGARINNYLAAEVLGEEALDEADERALKQ